MVFHENLRTSISGTMKYTVLILALKERKEIFIFTILVSQKTHHQNKADEHSYGHLVISKYTLLISSSCNCRRSDILQSAKFCLIWWSKYLLSVKILFTLYIFIMADFFHSVQKKKKKYFFETIYILWALYISV